MNQSLVDSTHSWSKYFEPLILVTVDRPSVAGLSYIHQTADIIQHTSQSEHLMRNGVDKQNFS